MNQSNSKLDKEQKSILRDMKDELLASGGAYFVNRDTGMVGVAMYAFPGSTTIRISTSVMSDNEKKFRKSVGLYTALDNMFYSEKFIHVPDVGHDLEFIAEQATNAFVAFVY